jgi:hypothetical protein
MSGTPSERPAGSDVRCPTCGAWQEWSDTCRRCKCDLLLLRTAVEAIQAGRRRCLWSLRAGRARPALRQARRLYALSPDRSTARLLAVCHVLCGNWTAAVATARIAEGYPASGCATACPHA